MKKNYPNTFFQIGLSGHLLFITLTILSFIFFKERIVFIDCAFHVFQFIFQGDFQIWNQRFIAVLTQIVPMWGVQEGWSLGTVLLSYSLSFALLYYFYFVIIQHFIKSEKAALAFLLFILLFVKDTFFWIQSEFPQSLALFFVFYALLKKRSNKWNLAIAYILTIPIIYGHPLMIFPFLFLIVYEILDQKALTDKLLASFILLAIGIFILKFFTLPSDSYEAKKISPFSKIGDLNLVLTNNLIFIKWLLKDYILLTIALVILCYHYVSNKYWLKMACVLSAFIGYSLLINLSHVVNPTHQFYFENLYLPISVFVAIGIANEIFKHNYFKKYLLPLLLLLIVFRCGFILKTSTDYTGRVQYIENVITKTHAFEERKFAIDKKHLDMDKIMLEWPLAFETLIFSSLKDNQQTRCIYVPKSNEKVEINNGPWVKHEWGTFDQTKLDKRYFNMPVTPYKILQDDYK